MAQPAAESDTRLTRVIPLLRPYPGRAGQTLRLSVIAAGATWLALYWGLPEAALAAYVPFFMSKPDRMLSTVLAVALMVIAALLVGTVILLAMVVLDDPMWRVATIAGVSFAICWLGSASKLKPIAPIMALVIAFGLDVLGANPLPVFTTKALLWAWWLVGVPALVTIAVNLLVAPAPRRLLSRLIAERLYAAADALLDEEGGPARLSAVLREDPREAALLLTLAKAEHTSRRLDMAAFASALQQCTAICLLAKAMTDGAERLPAARALLIAGHLRAMGDILAHDLYPTATALELPGKPPSDRLASIETALLAVLADFTTAAPPPQGARPGGGFMEPDALTNPAHVHYALKTTGAAMVCFLLYHALDWPGIHTAFLTCFIVALPTAAEAIEKLTLRLTGAMMGAIAGVVAMLVLVPVLENGVQLALLVLVATIPAAWLAVGSERISYVGFQWAFAFYLTVIQGAGPGFDITIARDRVIGVLVGNVVTYFMFTRVWPVSIAPQVDAALGEGLAALRAFAQSGSHGARSAWLDAALQSLAAARRGLAIARYEPGNLLPCPQWRSARRDALAQIDAELPALFVAGAGGDGTARAIAGRLESAAARPCSGAPPPTHPHSAATEAAP